MFAFLEVLSSHVRILPTLFETLHGEVILWTEAPKLSEGKPRNAVDGKNQSQTCRLSQVIPPGP